MPAIFNSILTGNLTIGVYLLCLATSFACGILAALAASYRSGVSKSFLVSLILLPAIVETVITMVNGNIGTGVAVMGAFSLVRFRSAAGRAKDIVSIFLVMTAGLACAAGYLAIALLFTLIVCAVTVVLARIPLGAERWMDLRITVPESLHFADEFEDLFGKYTKSHHLVKSKTTNMGSLYKLQYRVEMKDRSQVQEMIDKLRCRNGNLEISLADAAEGEDEL